MISIKKKIRAFTLSEMLVVLIITVIVVGLAFSVLNLVQKQMSQIQDGFAGNGERNRLKHALWRDFGTYSRIYYQETSNQLICESPTEKITYEFQENLVVRALDSFRIGRHVPAYYFLGKSQTSGEVDALEIKIFETENSPLFVYKTNTAETYMDYGF